MTEEVRKEFNTDLWEFNKLNREVKDIISDCTSSTNEVVDIRLTETIMNKFSGRDNTGSCKILSMKDRCL